MKNDRMGEFIPKDVDLNTDEPGCPTCHGLGLMPLVGEACPTCHNEAELATGREGQEGWQPTKAHNAKKIILLVKNIDSWQAFLEDRTPLDEDKNINALISRLKSKYPGCEFRYP